MSKRLDAAWADLWEQVANNPHYSGIELRKRIEAEARADALDVEAMRVVFDLARETLATRDRLVSSGWDMRPLPHEAEVRAILAEHKS